MLVYILQKDGKSFTGKLKVDPNTLTLTPIMTSKPNEVEIFTNVEEANSLAIKYELQMIPFVLIAEEKLMEQLEILKNSFAY